MILGYVLVGIVAGLVASAVAVLSGASLWFATGVYTLAGFTTVAIFSVVQFILNRLAFSTDVVTHETHIDDVTGVVLSEPASVAEPQFYNGGMRILAVDDDPFILDLVQTIASTTGITDIVTAQSGAEALTLLADPTMDFDYMLLDIRMPGIDGIDLCRKVREIARYRDTPITMLTAMRDVANMGEAFRAGADDYATKPFDIAQFSARLRAAQEKFIANREAAMTGKIEIIDVARQMTIETLERRSAGQREGVKSLIDRTAMSNYLTQLSRKDVSKVQIFAINIDLRNVIGGGSSPQRLAEMLDDVALATARSLGTDRTVMTFTQDTDLLVATHSAAPLSAPMIERDIERLLLGSAIHQDVGAIDGDIISVGGPVVMLGTGRHHGKVATECAVRLAETRAIEKRGAPLLAFHKA